MATLAALLTHVAGGGLMPSGLGILLAWTLTVVVSTVLTGRRISFVRLAIAIALSQVVFHALFVFGAVGASGLDTSAQAHHHHMTALPALSAGTLAALQADAAMWIWHGFAAVITTAVLYRGERTVQQLAVLARQVAQWTQRTLARRVSVPEPHSGLPRLSPAATAEFRITGGVFTTSLRRRGPPSLPVV